MSGETIAVVLSGIVGLIGAAVTARYAARAQNKATAAGHDVTSGELALKIATRADSRVTALEKKITRIRVWYREEHGPWDERVIDTLEGLAPGTIDDIGRPPHLPLDD